MRWITSTALLLAFVAAALLLAQCERSATERAAVGVSEARVAPAAWELARDPSEFVATLRGVAMRPERGPDGSETTGYAEGAELELWSVDPYGMDFQRVIARATAGAGGTFEIGPAPTDHWALRLRLDGHGPSAFGEGVLIPGIGGGDDALALEVGMLPGRPVPGRVTDGGGLPVADVRVFAVSMAYFEEARTDSEGHFELTMPDAECQVWIADPHWESARTTFDPSRAGESELTLWTDPREPVRGWVTDTASGTRVPGAVVQSVQDPRVRTRTDDDGRFELLLPERHALAAFADGLAWRSVVPPTAGEVEVRLTAAPRVTGRVVDADGRPVQAARILAVTAGVEGRLEVVTGPLTDAEGRFECTWLPPAPRGASVATHWFARRRGLGRSAARPLGEGGDAGELRLSGLRDVSGTVRGFDGAALGGAEVEVRWGASDLPDEQAAAAGVVTGRRAVVANDGSYTLRDVPADRDLEVVARAWGVEVGLPLAAGSAAARLEFSFPEGDPLSGRVVDAYDRPVATDGVVRAMLLEKGDARLAVNRTTALEEDGSFYFADLPPGPYQLLAEFDGYDRAGLLVKSGLDDVELRLARPGSVTVSAGLPAGVEPDAGPGDVPRAVLVPVERGEAVPNTEPMERTERGWSVRFAPVREGVYEVRVEAGVWRARIERFDVADGHHAELDVELRRTRGVTLELVRADGSPVAGELVVLAPERPGPELRPQHARTGPDGRAFVAGLAPGAWRARVLAVGAPALEERLEVTEDEDAVQRLVLPAGGSVRVEGLDADGAPLEGAILRARHPDGAELYFQTDADEPRRSAVRLDAEGRADLAALPAGPVVLELEVDGARVERSVEVVAGRVVPVRFD